jgi:hypothetical protein
MPGINQDSLYDLYTGNISYSVSKTDLPTYFSLKSAYTSSAFYVIPALYTRTPKGGYFAAEKILTRDDAKKLSAMLPPYAFIYYPAEANDGKTVIAPTIFNAVAAIKLNGTLWGWGNGPLGIDSCQSIKDTPTQLGTEKDWRSVSVGLNNVFAIKGGTSALWSWGDDQYGATGRHDFMGPCVMGVINKPVS